MNRFEIPRTGGEAKIRYLTPDYQVVSPGSYVVCAITGKHIPLDELKYWSVERQEAYVDALAASTGHERGK
ncbi:MAG: DUF2093 domain-containing protein [Stappiaceae bacterium]